MQQIPLKLSVNKDYRFEGFWTGPNAHLVQEVQHQINLTSSSQWIFLQGVKGFGKSHLLQACCQLGLESGLNVSYLAFSELCSFWLENKASNNLEGNDQWLEAFAESDWLFIDDLDFKLAPTESDRKVIDESLFMLVNHCLLTQNTRLMFTSSIAVDQLDFRLEDLRSRLRLVQIINLKSFDDEEMLDWLRFKAAYFGFDLDGDAAVFLLRRWPRDLNALTQALNKINEFSLAEQRRVTIPAIKLALAI